jgi:hypothetical protein
LLERNRRITGGKTCVIIDVLVGLPNIPAIPVVIAALPLTAFFTDPLGRMATTASAAREAK